MLRQGSHDQTGIHLRDDSSGSRDARLHEHLEPHAEAIGVELLVHAWLIGAPQVEVEYAGQLSRCRQGHELAAVFESAGLNDAVQHFWLQMRDDAGELWHVEDAFEQTTRGRNGQLCGGALRTVPESSVARLAGVTRRRRTGRGDFGMGRG